MKRLQTDDRYKHDILTIKTSPGRFHQAFLGKRHCGDSRAVAAAPAPCATGRRPKAVEAGALATCTAERGGKELCIVGHRRRRSVHPGTVTRPSHVRSRRALDGD